MSSVVIHHLWHRQEGFGKLAQDELVLVGITLDSHVHEAMRGPERYTCVVKEQSSERTRRRRQLTHLTDREKS